MTDNPQDILAALDQLLTKERAHLLQGNLHKFPELLQEKETLLARLSAVEKQRLPDLEPVQNRMVYNQGLLESAMRGIRATAERLKALRDIRDGLETYDSHGQRHSFAPERGEGLEKRA